MKNVNKTRLSGRKLCAIYELRPQDVGAIIIEKQGGFWERAALYFVSAHEDTEKN